MASAVNGEGWEVPNYEHGSSMFSVRVHYGGELQHYPKREYVGGKRNLVDWCDPDRWSLCELDDISESLGLEKYSMRYYYCIPGKALDDGLICMISDNDALKAAEYGAKFRLIDIYIVEKRKVLTIGPDGEQIFSSPPKRIKRAARKRVKIPHKFNNPTPSVARKLDVEVEIDDTIRGAAKTVEDGNLEKDVDGVGGTEKEVNEGEHVETEGIKLSFTCIHT